MPKPRKRPLSLVLLTLCSFEVAPTCCNTLLSTLYSAPRERPLKSQCRGYRIQQRCSMVVMLPTCAYGKARES